ncbi:hypothetical protein, partial [Salmonella enterica]|uniref:hypothetical protein n=1 Tax=Salmonella enterica TaxID=28901 RepID=UPI001C4E13AE
MAISVKQMRDRLTTVENTVATGPRVNAQVASKAHNAADSFSGWTPSRLDCGGACSWTCSN